MSNSRLVTPEVLYRFRSLDPQVLELAQRLEMLCTIDVREGRRDDEPVEDHLVHAAYEAYADFESGVIREDQILAQGRKRVYQRLRGAGTTARMTKQDQRIRKPAVAQWDAWLQPIDYNSVALLGIDVTFDRPVYPIESADLEEHEKLKRQICHHIVSNMIDLELRYLHHKTCMEIAEMLGIAPDKTPAQRQNIVSKRLAAQREEIRQKFSHVKLLMPDRLLYVA